MIVVVCPNPAIDRTVLVERLTVGFEARGRLVTAAAGGKGFNVARALHTLGRRVTVVAPVGGATGQQLSDLAADERYASNLVPVAGETRVCTILTDGAGTDTVVNETGVAIDAEEWHRLCNEVAVEARGATIGVVSGSLPPIESVDPLGELMSALSSVQVWVDTSGDVLRRAAELKPAGIKVNRREAIGLARPPETTLVVTAGADGASVENSAGRWVAGPLRGLHIRSAVGSGDSFLAGWLTGIDQGVPRALRLASAAGADNACRIGGGLIDPVEVERLASMVEVTAG